MNKIKPDEFGHQNKWKYCPGCGMEIDESHGYYQFGCDSCGFVPESHQESAELSLPTIPSDIEIMQMFPFRYNTSEFSTLSNEFNRVQHYRRQGAMQMRDRWQESLKNK